MIMNIRVAPLQSRNWIFQGMFDFCLGWFGSHQITSVLIHFLSPLLADIVAKVSKNIKDLLVVIVIIIVTT